MNAAPLIENQRQDVATKNLNKAVHVVGRCRCKETFYWNHGEWDHCPLEGDNHTSFYILRCKRCMGLFGFPDGNLDIALERGTPETKRKLQEIFAENYSRTHDLPPVECEEDFKPQDDLDVVSVLDARQARDRRWIDQAVNFGLGFVAGAIVMTAIFLIHSF